MSSFEDKEKQAKGLTRQLEILTETTDSFALSVINASNESKKWTAVSRFLSGSGLWRFQNYLRGALQVMSFFNDSQREAIEANIQQAQTLSDLYDVQEESMKQIDLINKIKDEGIESINKEIAANDELAIAIQKQYKVIKNAIDQARKDKKIQMTEEQAHAEAIRRTATAYEYVEEKIKENMASRVKVFAKSIAREMKVKAKIEKRATLEERKERIKERKEDIEILERLKKKGVFASFDTKEKKRIGARLGGLRTQQKRAQERVKKEEKEISPLTNIMAGFKPIRNIMRGLYDIFTLGPFWKSVSLISKKVQDMGGWIKGSWKLIKTVGGFIKKYMLLGLMFILGAFLVFSFIREILKNAEVMNTVITALQEIFGAVFLVLSGFFDIFQAFFGGGTFGERLGTLLSGFMKIFGGLGAIIFSVGKGILKLAVGLAIGILTTYIKIIVGLFSASTWVGIWDKLKEKVFNKVEAWWANLDIKGKFVGWVAAIINKMLGPLNTLLGWFGAEPIQMLAKGGIAKGGLTLVGERGPELVNLPKGARVHSNAESRRMGGNTINVNVSGRVGASDSELRDIAKKIGRMVNTEINRTTSSSTNVRY